MPKLKPHRGTKKRVRITKTGYVEPSVTPTPSPGDGNGDNLVDGLDFVIWLTHYNQTVSGGNSVGDYNNNGFQNKNFIEVVGRTQWVSRKMVSKF